MVVAGLVLLANVLIWTVPDSGGVSPADRANEKGAPLLGIIETGRARFHSSAYSGICQRTALEKLPDVFSPEVSRAGSNRARRVARSQVASSSALWPVDLVTVHPVTLPFAATSRRKLAVPSYPLLIQLLR